jgi:hypothetical protein
VFFVQRTFEIGQRLGMFRFGLVATVAQIQWRAQSARRGVLSAPQD